MFPREARLHSREHARGSCARRFRLTGSDAASDTIVGLLAVWKFRSEYLFGWRRRRTLWGRSELFSYYEHFPQHNPHSTQNPSRRILRLVFVFVDLLTQAGDRDPCLCPNVVAADG